MVPPLFRRDKAYTQLSVSTHINRLAHTVIINAVFNIRLQTSNPLIAIKTSVRKTFMKIYPCHKSPNK